MTTPKEAEAIPAEVMELAKERADWLVDAVACSTQNRMFLRGEKEEDEVATESIYLNGKKAIEVAIMRDRARPAPDGGEVEPVAWMRRWAYEKIEPYKERGAQGRMVWAMKFKFKPVTAIKILPDDVPLYAAPPSPAASTSGGEVAGFTLGALQKAHIERQEEWCPDQKPDLSFRGNEMAGEVGEACNVIKKLERERQGWRGSRATKEQLAEELADVIHTAVLCAITAGIDIEPATVAKFNATSDKNGLASRIRSTLVAAPTSHHEKCPDCNGTGLTVNGDVCPTCLGNTILADPVDADGGEVVRELVEALEWYGEQVRLCRLIHSGGDTGRHALAADGGKRAKAALAKLGGARG